MESMLMDAKIALITGGSSGIGKATAITLARAGCRIGLVARREDKLREVVDDIVREGGEAGLYVADVGKEEDATGAVAWAEATFGAVDILVNNAGIIRPGPIASSDAQGWRDTFDINVLAPMYLARAALPGMQERRRGHIVNISSNAAKRPGAAGNAAYSASKYGVTALSAALRKEVAAYGIRVTVIEPGTTATGVADSIPDEATRARMDTHMHKAGNMQAEDIANAILYAVSQPERVNVEELWLTPTAYAD